MSETKTNSSETPRLQRAPLLGPAGVLLAGVVLGRFLPLGTEFWWLLLAGAGLGGALALRRAHLRGVAVACVLTAVLAAGAVRLHLAWFAIPKDHIVWSSDTGRIAATVRGTVLSPMHIYQPAVPFGYQPHPRASFLLDVAEIKTADGWRPARGQLRVTLEEPYRLHDLGTPVELIGWLGRYSEPSNPGEFDAAEMARRTGVLCWFRVPAEDGMCVWPVDRAPWRAMLDRIRRLPRQHLAEAGTPDDGRLVNALVLGERSPALRDLSETMTRAGIAHFLSISGMHMGVFLGFVYLLGRLARLSPRRAAWGVLLVLVGYVLVAEARAPLLRTGLMAAALCVAVLTRKRTSMLNALLLAGIILLLLDPRQAFQAGFQMSFGIVLGLVLLARPLHDALFARWRELRELRVATGPPTPWRRLGRVGSESVRMAVAYSLAAYLVGAPLAAYHFGLFSPYAAVLSVLLFPLVAAVLIPGYLAMALGAVVPNLAAMLADAAGIFAGILRDLVDRLDHLPLLSIELRPIGPAVVLLWYAVLLAVVFYRKLPRGRLILGGLAVVLGAATTWSQWPSLPAGRGAFHVLSVGAGQCAMLHTPGGKAYVFDAGTRSGFDAYRRVIRPFLQAKQLPAPSGLFVSHANTDHYSAMPDLLVAGAPPLYLCEPFGRANDAPDRAATLFLDRARRAGVALHRLHRGNRVPLDEQTEVEVLWPPADLPPTNANDTSLVLRVTCGGSRILLPGDIGEAPMRALLAKPEQLRADVLVLPHHGSWEPLLPAFVEAVDPRVVLCSAGRGPLAPLHGAKTANAFYNDLKKRRRYFSTHRRGWVGVELHEDGPTVRTMR